MTAVDGAWLEAVLLELLRTPTSVPAGHTEVEPGAPEIVRAVEEVVLPRIEDLGPAEVRRHPAGDAAARFGPEGPGGVLVQTYVVSQHANLMEDPHAARVVDGGPHGLEGPCALGQGATQNKGAMASALAAVRALPQGLSRPVWLAVNTEGRSSHDGSRRILDDLGIEAAWGVVAIGTDLRTSLGNRGRVDVRVTVKGASSHSSQPWLGTNPIEGAADVVRALRSLPLPEPHAVLGPATATPYGLSCFPVAPHTIPERAAVVVDRRLLPGESVDAAVDGVRAHLAAAVPDADVEVDQGVSMLPAEVAPEAAVVRALVDGVERATGRRGETFWSLNAFDAGYACSKGIPTPMFGPGRRRFSGAGLVGVDLVPLRDCVAAAEALAHALTALCGRP